MSILGSLVSTLLASVLFGIAAEIILGDDAVLEYAPSPPVRFPTTLLFAWPHLPLSRIFYCVHHSNVLGGSASKVGEVWTSLFALLATGILYTLFAVAIDVRRFNKQRKGVIRKGAESGPPQCSEDGGYGGFELTEVRPNFQGELLGGVGARSNDDEEDGKDDTILTLRDVSKVYKKGTFALQGVTFGVKRTKCCGLLGKNGAGKSTIQKIIAGR